MIKGSGTFNFRDIVKRLDIPATNKNHWAVGQVLSAAAAKRGVAQHYLLTEKTDPGAKVPAKHFISAYPMAWFDEALGIVRDWWADGSAQIDMFDGGE
jgi:hypothetical protein